MSLPLYAFAIIFSAGLTVSALGTLAGLGGGVFMVPLLVLGFGVPLKIAIPAITFCLFPSALISTIFNVTRKRIDYKTAISLEVPTVLGAIAGASVIGYLPLRILEVLFSGLVFFLGYKILTKKKEKQTTGMLEAFNRMPPLISGPGNSYSASVPALGFFGFFSGLLAGIFGVGGGIIKTPVMLRIFRMPMERATATSLFMITFTSLTAAFTHWQNGRLDWGLALPISGSFIAGSLLANSFGSKMKSSTLEKVLGWVLIAAAGSVLLHTYIKAS